MILYSILHSAKRCFLSQAIFFVASFFVSIIRFVLFGVFCVCVFLLMFFFCFLGSKESSPKMSMLDFRGVEGIDTHLTL